MASLTIDDNSIISDDDYDCSATNIFSSPLTYITSTEYILESLECIKYSISFVVFTTSKWM